MLEIMGQGLMVSIWGRIEQETSKATRTRTRSRGGPCVLRLFDTRNGWDGIGSNVQLWFSSSGFKGLEKEGEGIKNSGRMENTTQEQRRRKPARIGTDYRFNESIEKSRRERGRIESRKCTRDWYLWQQTRRITTTTKNKRP